MTDDTTPPPENKTVTQIPTSLTLEYRTNWGLERIVLDGMSNHLPQDSKGTQAHALFKQDGLYVPFTAYDSTKPVEEIVFSDDGKGYPATRLHTLRSTKIGEPGSVGRFGEGLKLVSAAAVRLKIPIEFQSRNWYATPYGQQEKDEGETYSRLCFNLTENGHTIQGSRTVFTMPSAELIAEVLQLPQKVLYFDPDIEELYNEKYGAIDPHQIIFNASKLTKISFRQKIDYKLSTEDILDLDYSNDSLPTINDMVEIDFPGNLQQQKPISRRRTSKYHSRIIKRKCEEGTSQRAVFVKGVLFQQTNTLFSYDLGLEEIPRDRTDADEKRIVDCIEELLKGCTNTEVIQRVLEEATRTEYSTCLEMRAFDTERNLPFYLRNQQHELKTHTKNQKTTTSYEKIKAEPNAWANTFRTMYGDNAVIASFNDIENSDAESMGFKPIKINMHVAKYLRSYGIETAQDQAKCVKHEFRWIGPEQITKEERCILTTLEDITELYLGERKPIEVRLYEGVYTSTGREIESALGVHIKESSGQQYIGLKRSHLQDGLEQVAQTYTHELAHFETDANDGTREHAQYGFDLATKLALKLLQKQTK